LRHNCSGLAASGCIAENASKVLFEITRTTEVYLKLRLKSKQ
jgi:hypothetical protein